MRATIRYFALLLIATFVAASAGADWKLFLPRAVDNGGAFELFGSTERDENRYGERSIDWTDDFLKGRVTLFSRGYAYHPRFLQYQVEVGGSVKRERFDSTTRAESGWRSDNGFEYKARLYLLPEHPYHLELFALRWEPVFKDHAAIARDSVSTTYGADVRYERKPYFVGARYTDDSLDSSLSSSNVKRLGLDGEYFRRWANGNQVTVNAAFNPKRYSNSVGLHGDASEALLSNTLIVGSMSLYSSLTRDEIDQSTDFDGRFTSDQLVWYERMTAQLPLHFRTDLTWRWQDGSTSITDPFSGRVRELETEDKDVEVALVHRLYESLQSTLTHRRTWRDSGLGSNDSVSSSLAFNYSKKIPHGRVLAGASWGRAEAQSSGTTDVVDEQHGGIAVPGTLTLARHNVEPGSLTLFLRSPIAPFEAVRLVENEHYVVGVVGDTVEVTVFTLPAPFVVPGSFDFFASYRLLGGEFELRSDFTGHSLSIELFDSMLTPYYSYFRSVSEVVAGVYPGTGPDATTVTAGLRFVRGPVRARVEWQDVQWEVSPYEAWRSELQYIGALTRTTDLYATASYWQREYPHGRGSIDGAPLEEDTETLSATLNQRLFDRALTLSIGGSYSQTQSIVDTESTAFNAVLQWQVGKLDFSAGATLSDAQSVNVSLPDSERKHHYYYLKLRRELF